MGNFPLEAVGRREGGRKGGRKKGREGGRKKGIKSVQGCAVTSLKLRGGGEVGRREMTDCVSGGRGRRDVPT